jgi:hypothetical protein
MEYKILWANTIPDLEMRVRRAIEDRWMPQGGVSIAPKTGNEVWGVFAQAMTRSLIPWNHTKPDDQLIQPVLLIEGAEVTS